MAKLRGLAEFAEKYLDRYQRIDALATNSAGKVVLLEMKDPKVRAAVRKAETAISLYDGAHARAYL
jgi:hypothetical protein